MSPGMPISEDGNLPAMHTVQKKSEKREKHALPIKIYPVMDDLDEIRPFAAWRKPA